MKSRWFLVLVELSIWLNTGHGAAIGQGVCNFQPSIIRTPKILLPIPVSYRVVCTKTPGPQPYTPISNACSSCVNTRVTPATIARVDYDLTATTPSSASGTAADGADEDPQPIGERGGAFFPAVAGPCDAAAAGPGGYPVSEDPPGPDGIDEPAAAGDDGCGCGGPRAAAVDPVSLALAQAEANRCRGDDVREGRLAFGPAAVPKDATPPPAAAAPDVDEEGLYALDKAIVELKTCKRSGQADAALASDTDARLALEEDARLDEDAAAAGPAVALPSYADVGYRPETPSCAPLVGGVSVPAAVDPKPTVVYDGTTCAASRQPAYVAEYSPRYCAVGGDRKPCTSPRYQCPCDKCSGGVYPCGKCSCGKCSC